MRSVVCAASRVTSSFAFDVIGLFCDVTDKSNGSSEDNMTPLKIIVPLNLTVTENNVE